MISAVLGKLSSYTTIGTGWLNDPNAATRLTLHCFILNCWGKRSSLSLKCEIGGCEPEDAGSYHSFIHSFIHSIYSKHLLCAKDLSGFGDKVMDKLDSVLLWYLHPS